MYHVKYVLIDYVTVIGKVSGQSRLLVVNRGGVRGHTQTVTMQGTGAPNHCVLQGSTLYTMFFSYAYIPMIKFNSQIRHTKRLTITN